MTVSDLYIYIYTHTYHLILKPQKDINGQGVKTFVPLPFVKVLKSKQ